MKRIAVVLMLLVSSASLSFAGPIFPTRGILLHPKWSAPTDTTAVFDHGGYWAQVQHGFNSDSDRWGWSVIMGAMWEFARWGGNKSLIGFAGMELTANTHNDISFKPKGAHWEEGLIYAVHESDRFDWQLGTIYRCRHDLDNIDPRGYSSIGEQRTLIYCSLEGKTIWKSEKILGLHIPTTAWLHADAYLIREDYRIPESDAGIGTEFNHLAWSFGEAFQSKFAEWANSAVYLMVYTNYSAFSSHTGFLNRFTDIAQSTFDSHWELGYEFHGRAGRLQLYGGWEDWQDDGQTPIPRNTFYAMLGIRVTGTDLVTF